LDIAGMLPADWGDGWANVWLGTTTENQIEATRRIPYLVAIPAAARFLCVEPMLEAIDLSPWLGELDWLIVGGESGVGSCSRPMHPDCVRDLRDQVRAAGGALFLKQVGSNRALWPGVEHRKGENPIEWPPDLQIQDLPRRSGPSM
jgi:protein gp37